VIVALAEKHRARLAELLKATPEFTPDEREVALELIDSTLDGSDPYRVLIDVVDGSPGADDHDDEVRGYICFGPTPMTRGTFDLYWIATHPSHKGRGVGRALVAAMETALRNDGARLVRVETSGLAEYAATRAFYDRIGYEVVARIRDFYWPGNDLVIYGRYLA
jgi:ribosomal protein S18 acetylase RimI-like enzyme